MGAACAHCAEPGGARATAQMPHPPPASQTAFVVFQYSFVCFLSFFLCFFLLSARAINVICRIVRRACACIFRSVRLCSGSSPVFVRQWITPFMAIVRLNGLSSSLLFFFSSSSLLLFSSSLLFFSSLLLFSFLLPFSVCLLGYFPVCLQSYHIPPAQILMLGNCLFIFSLLSFYFFFLFSFRAPFLSTCGFRAISV